MPDYQSGTPPFDTQGGDWAFDAQGHAIVQRLEPAHVVLTVPRAPMPAAGYPLLVMIRTGGGGDRPLVDRGVQAKTGGAAITPGTGPAMELAGVGWAGASIDGPHGGLRNVTNADEQFLMFNVANGAALRDNVRESALEIAVFERVLEGLTFDTSDCPGASATSKFDATRVALMGHSMGATIAPLTLAVEPSFRGAVLSGAGASWIENVLYKEHPVAVRPLIELLLGYTSAHRALVRGDPVLTMMQWALEPADPMVYTRLVLQEPAQGETPRQILMEQGIVDHYILPPIANGMSLSLGLDLAGAELDLTHPELVARPELTPLASVLGYSGRKKIALPASANVSKDVTAIVVQHLEDGIEDGHEVMFQTDAPKREYRCFLQSLAQGGAARVPDGNVPGPCP
jgi:pimeloyl-ACP methyl ester carboxylesterase